MELSCLVVAIIMIIIVIFKHLSLNALSTLQEHEGDGGMG